MKERPPYLIRTITRHGAVAWYVWRRPGPKIRIRGEYGSREFQAAYKTALYGVATPKRAEGSLAELIADYRESRAWLAQAEATRKTRDLFLRQIERAAGRTPIADIDRAAILATREKAANVSAARGVLTTLRALFKWAVDAGRMDENPAAGVKIPPAPRTRGYHTWTDDEIAAYEARWPLGTRQRLWLAVLQYTGLRRGDATRLRWDDIRDGVIRVRTRKTGTPVAIPVEPELAEALAAGPTGREYVLEGEHGRPYTPQSFSVLFGRAARAAGVPGSAHGVRKATTTRLAHAGGTVSELNAALGWTGSRMAIKYTEAADRERLAKAAHERARKRD